MVKQSLPCGQTRHYQSGANSKVYIGRKRCEVTCLNSYILCQRTIARPISEAKYPLSHGKSGCSISEGGNNTSQFVTRDRGRPVVADTIGPGGWPGGFILGESRRVNLNNYIVYCWFWIWQLRQFHSGYSCSL